MDTESLPTGASATHSSSQPRLRRRWRVFAMIFISYLLMIFGVTASFGSWARHHMQGALEQDITRNLTQKAQMLANRVNADRTHGLDVIASQEGQSAGARATIVDSNGKVVADSEISAASLENEGRRTEFVTALHGSTGVETRTRNGVPVLYVAVPVSGGAVRLAYPLSDIEVANEAMNRRLLWACTILAFLALLPAAAFTRLVVR